MRYYALIVASGSGKRMNDATPKQFTLINGLPVLFYSLRAFAASRYAPEIILILHGAHREQWLSLQEKYAFNVPVTLVTGGEERFHSVKNGLSRISGTGIVAIHDGARPMITTETVDRLYKHAVENGSAIPTVTPTESIRLNEKVVDRSSVSLVQTPQVFDVKGIVKAYDQAYASEFTDDASVAESKGMVLSFAEGQRDNLKITWPVDLTIASVLLK